MPVTTKTRVGRQSTLSTFTSVSTSGVVTVTSQERDVSSVTYESKSKNWVNTPNFRARRAAHEVLPDNTFIYSEWSKATSVGWATNPLVNMGFGSSGNHHRYGDWATSGILLLDPSIDQTSLYGKLIDKAKGQQWNLPVFFAEARKTSSMVVDRATQLAELALLLRRGRFNEFASRLHKSVTPPSKTRARKFQSEYGKDARRASANAWLEYSYGWVPFMSDVRNAVNTLMDLSDRPSALVSSQRASVKRESGATSPLSLIFADPSYNVYIRGRYVDSVSESCRVKWKYRANPLDLPGKLGLLNPMEVVWELVPFSFVVDWFLPIGDYLSALDAPLRYSHIGGTVGKRVETKRVTVPVSRDGGKPWGGFSGLGRYVYVQRTALTQMPNVKLSSMSFNADLGANRVISSISLLSQQLDRLGRGR